jgi:hypothetical protein
MDYTRVILTVTPFIFSIGLLPMANRVKPIVLGLPFLAFWLTLGIYVAFACIWLLYSYDNRQRKIGLTGKETTDEQ